MNPDKILDKLLMFLMVVAAIILFVGIVYSQSQRNGLMNACEAELPRGQQCELIAVPKEK
jgi:hypothetical protein